MATSDNTSDKNRVVVQKDNLAQKLQLELAEKLMGTFDLVISGRSKYYNENPDKIPTPAAVPSIIALYSTKNMAVSGGISLIPGPWGMAAAVPEVAIVIANQLYMIYDIGMAYGKSQVLNKELLAGVFLSAMGAGAGGLLVMHGGKVLVRRVALRVFQRIILLLAGKVTQQMLKSLISKWLPIIGAAAMAAWSYYMTRQIGNKAIEILEKPVEIVDEEIEDEKILEEALIAQATKREVPAIDSMPNYTVLKIKALLNLMKIDKKITSTERTYIETLIENSGIDDSTKIELANLIDAEAKAQVDFTLFAKEPDEATGMLFDFVALAKRDGEFHLAEKIYIKQAGKMMGLSEGDIEAVMSTE